MDILKPAEQVRLACRVMLCNVSFGAACPDDLRVVLFARVKDGKRGITRKH